MNSFQINSELLSPEIIAAIRRALDEDVGSGDITTNVIVPQEASMSGEIIAKQVGIIAGLGVAQMVYTMFDPRVQFEACVPEGIQVNYRQRVAKVSGPARSLLTAERTALNFLGRMSGIATLTHQFVEAIANSHAVILDTRKTAPGLRMVDKLAVRLGGGQNHRVGLYDMVLIKDNHIDFAGSVEAAIRLAQEAAVGVEIEVETRTLSQVEEALKTGAGHILLDNMSLEQLREAVKLTDHRATLEASGNVSLATVRQIAETGVDYISIGALTHSAPVLDLSFLYLD